MLSENAPLDVDADPPEQNGPTRQITFPSRTRPSVRKPKIQTKESKS
jgi:hypothetical protein